MMDDLKISGFTMHSLKEIVNEGMAKRDRSVHIFFGPIHTSIQIHPWKEENEIDISGIAEARSEISLALITNNYKDRSDDVRECLLKALGKLDKFLHENGNEEG